MQYIYGRDLKTGDVIEAWMPEQTRTVLELTEYREQELNGEVLKLCTAICSDRYNITVMLDRKDIRLVRG